MYFFLHSYHKVLPNSFVLRKIARFTSLLRIDNVNVAIYKIYKYLFMFTYSFEYIMYVPINIYMHVILAVVFHYLAFII